MFLVIQGFYLRGKVYHVGDCIELKRDPVVDKLIRGGYLIEYSPDLENIVNKLHGREMYRLRIALDFFKRKYPKGIVKAKQHSESNEQPKQKEDQEKPKKKRGRKKQKVEETLKLDEIKEDKEDVKEEN